jgi:hypothetical protein
MQGYINGATYRQGRKTMKAARSRNSKHAAQFAAAQIATLLDLAWELQARIPVNEADSEERDQQVSTLLLVTRDIARTIARSRESA